MARLIHDLTTRAGRRIVVLDEATDPEQTGMFYEYIANYGRWNYNPHSSGDENDYNDNVAFIHGFDNGLIKGSPFFVEQLAPQLEAHFGPGFVPYDCSVNHGRFGDNPTDHRDTYNAAATDITMLLYLNPSWNLNHGGETVFLDEEGEIELSVLPRFCRLVLFEGFVNHLARPPSRLFQGARFTLAIKSLQAGAEDYQQDRAHRHDAEHKAERKRHLRLYRTLFGRLPPGILGGG